MKKIFTLLLLSGAWLSIAQNNFDAFMSAPDAYWTFEDGANLGKAYTDGITTYGNDLVLNGNITQVPGSGGTDQAVLVTKNGAFSSYLGCTPNVPANGGGTRINQWSIMVDFSAPGLTGWSCILDNAGGDGELYLKNNSVGSGTIWGWYTGAPNVISANTWYRYVVTVDLTAAAGSQAQLYMNGAQWMNGGSKVIDDTRVSLDPASFGFFGPDAADNEQDQALSVAQIAFWGRALNSAEVGLLGGPTLATPKFSAADNSLKVYPNPVSSNARISFNLSSASKNANIDLIDMTGRVVESIYKGSLDQGEQTITWNLNSKYNAGTYLVKLSTENTNQVYSILMK